MKLTGRSFFTFRQFIGNIHKKYNYQNKSGRYLDICIYFPEIIHFCNLFSHQTVISKNTIPKVISKINTRLLNRFAGKFTLGPINAVVNQAAEILIDNPENALNQGRYFFLLT